MRTFKWLPPSDRRVLPTPSAALLISLLVLPLGLACGSDSFKPVPPVEPNELYWDLVLNHRAVLLAMAAPYDTLTLVATPRNFRGEALPGLPPAQYSSDDIDYVTVAPDGVLHAIAPTPPGTVVRITATLLAGNLKYTDHVVVRVVSGDAPPMVASLSIHPLPADSAKVALTPTAYAEFGYQMDTLPVRAADAAGTPISTIPGSPDGVVPVDIRPADTTMLQAVGGYYFPTRNVIQGSRVGTTKIYASTTALGITLADTLEYRVGWPVSGFVQVVPSGSTYYSAVTSSPGSNIFRNAPDLTIGVGGFVVWANNADTMFQSDIHFTEADASNVVSFTPTPAVAPFWLPYFCSPEIIGFLVDCTNGGDALLGPEGTRWAIRVFPVPGTYEYTSTQHPGSGGRIVVVDER